MIMLNISTFTVSRNWASFFQFYEVNRHFVTMWIHSDVCWLVFSQFMSLDSSPNNDTETVSISKTLYIRWVHACTSYQTYPYHDTSRVSMGINIEHIRHVDVKKKIFLRNIYKSRWWRFIWKNPAVTCFVCLF